MKTRNWILILSLLLAGCGDRTVTVLHDEVALAIVLYFEEYGHLPPLQAEELVRALDKGNPKGVVFWTMPDGHRSPDGGIENRFGSPLRIELIGDRSFRITSEKDDSQEVVTAYALPEPVDPRSGEKPALEGRAP